MTVRISEVAACCSSASARRLCVSPSSWVCWLSCFWRASVGPRRRAAVACLRRLSPCALRLRALVGSLLALERRRIAHPKGLGLRRFSKWDYSRDLRPAKWGSGASLHGSNPELLMSALGHVWTAPWQELSDIPAALVGCGHVSGLFVRQLKPLAIMLCADRVP